MDDFGAARVRMVDSQLRTENVTDYDVLAAMGAVPRERFVPADDRALAYLDRALAVADGRGLMRPAALGKLLQLAEIGAGERMLVVGCGTGYAAAVAGRLAATVIALEADKALADQAVEALAATAAKNVSVVRGPLESGWPAEAPYDVILLDGAVEVVPAPLLAQLKDGGRLVTIVGYGQAAIATIFTRGERDIGRRTVFNAEAPALPGFQKPKEFVF
jgi:protein-L-isoaspartate(D-aspartate) O-methyltransferase